MIGPAENGSTESPSPALPDVLYFGVLRPTSSLVAIFTSRVVPLERRDPKIVKIGGRFVKVIEIPYAKLLPEHQVAVLEWLKRTIPPRFQAEAEERVKSTGILDVRYKHFAGVVAAKAKDQEGQR